MVFLVDLVLALFVLTSTVLLGLLAVRLLKSFNDSSSNKENKQ